MTDLADPCVCGHQHDGDCRCGCTIFDADNGKGWVTRGYGVPPYSNNMCYGDKPYPFPPGKDMIHG